MGSSLTWECMVQPEASRPIWHVACGTNPTDDPFHREFPLFPMRHRAEREEQYGTLASTEQSL